MRVIKGNNPGNIKKYIKSLFKDIDDHNVTKKARELIYSVNFDKDNANKLDQIITKGKLIAEKECEHTYRLPWDKVTHLHTIL